MRTFALAATLAATVALTITAGPALAATPDHSSVTVTGTITGRILGPDGAPAANTDIYATNVNTAAQHTARTSADGTYRLRVQADQTFIVSYAVGRYFEYVPHTFRSNEATEFFVPARRTIRVDDRAIALAGVTGRLTGAAGAPAAGVTVRVTNVDTANESETTTLQDGTYDLSGQIPPGVYKVSFTVADRTQYAHQAADWNSAADITLTSGTTSIVDDQLLWDPAS
ncbi:carboxypeptidase-like regulatory domain-containing protein [Winogradskya humida]|uniref:carboxypeptidase-like regulatory domain-containing protein n=1 Tax=Winogradskya humida TaxID=113566 RepID=UPI001942649D|nr:carboxypeptidase-like regulatory domain-containing protein [Actinoplanes humidus]